MRFITYRRPDGMLCYINQAMITCVIVDETQEKGQTEVWVLGEKAPFNYPNAYGKELLKVLKQPDSVLCHQD